MKAMSKSELADRAGVSVNTLMNWCKPFQQELDMMGIDREIYQRKTTYRPLTPGNSSKRKQPQNDFCDCCTFVLGKQTTR